MRFDAQYVVAQGAAKLLEAKFGGLKRKMKKCPSNCTSIVKCKDQIKMSDFFQISNFFNSESFAAT